MGTDYFIACHLCKEFISLHKWPITDNARNALLSSFPHLSSHYALEPQSPFKPYDVDTSSPKARLVGKDVLEAIDSYQPEQAYIRRLIPVVRQFATVHSEHQLFLACDIGDLPWEIGEPSFTDWKEIPGDCYSHLYLPRNLVQVHRIRQWEDALALLQKKCKWILDPQLSEALETIQTSFEERVGEHKDFG